MLTKIAISVTCFPLCGKVHRRIMLWDQKATGKQIMEIDNQIRHYASHGLPSIVTHMDVPKEQWEKLSETIVKRKI